MESIQQDHWKPLPQLREVQRKVLHMHPIDPDPPTAESIAKAKAATAAARAELTAETGITFTDEGAQLAQWSRPFSRHLRASLEVAQLAVLLHDAAAKYQGQSSAWENLTATQQREYHERAASAVRGCSKVVTECALWRAQSWCQEHWQDLIAEIQATALEPHGDELVEKALAHFTQRIVNQYLVAVRDGSAEEWRRTEGVSK